MIKIGIPTGRLARMTYLFGASTISLEVALHTSRSLVTMENGRTIFRLRPSQIPPLICHGLLDEGFCGSDTLDEFPMRNLLEVVESHPQSGVRMVVAAADPQILDKDLGRPLVIGTSYPARASEIFASKRHIIVEQPGCIEGLCPRLVDVIVDIVETGKSLEENGLFLLQDLGELQIHWIRRKPSHGSHDPRSHDPRSVRDPSPSNQG